MNCLFYILLIIPLTLFASTEDDNKLPKELNTCFKAKLVKLEIEYTTSDIWSSPKEDPVCSLSFTVDSISPVRYYMQRSFKSPDYCKKFKKNWDKYIKKYKRVCIAAYLNEPYGTKHNGKTALVKSGYWETIKIGNWCHSYFVGYC